MGKNTHFTGQPLYSQILKFVDRSKILQVSQDNGYERYVKKLDGYTHFTILLFGILQRYDSLRELVVGMLSEANKFQHLGIDYCVKRSTISEANSRRSSDFFASIYAHLYERNKDALADSRTSRSWERLLYIMDSTTISRFSNILKGVGRNPKHGRKKGGIKAHTIIKATENVPHLIRYTSAATHDSFMLKEAKLPQGSFLAIDRAYINYSEFERLTKEQVYYVTKMKKNLSFKTLEDKMIVDSNGDVAFRECTIVFTKGEIKHMSRKIEYWKIDKKGEMHTGILLTNNFEIWAEDIVEIYNRRWQIETLYKQLKQNFPLKYFYGDSVNAIETQIWVTLIANLLLMLIKRRVKRKWAFSNMATMVRQMLMYYIDLYSYLEEPEKAWIKFNKQRAKSPPEWLLF